MANHQSCKQMSQGPCINTWQPFRGEISTCNRVFPLLEKLQTTWEALSMKHEYQHVQHALLAGLQNMDKWYQKTDDTSIYFVSHGIVFSWGSFSVTDKSTSWPPSSWSSMQSDLSWDSLGWRVGHPSHGSHEDHSKLLNTSCWVFSESLYFLSYREWYASQALGMTTTATTWTSNSIPKHSSTADHWMDSMIQWNKSKASTATQPLQHVNPYQGLDAFFVQPVVDCEDCPDIISWWGMSKFLLASVQAAITTSCYVP